MFAHSALALAITTASLAIAEEAENESIGNDNLIEEIIVTAQKRKQNVLDVPISVDVVQGEEISALGIGALDELSTLVPGLVVQEGAQSTRVSMRGMGSGPNVGFEQSVGMFIDGIYNGRDQLFRQPLVDVAAVEVIKGPQSSLFGKNTTAGAISITTAKPEDFFEAHLISDFTPEYNQYNTEAVVSGPLTETLRGRLAIKQSESDGYMDNKLLNEDAPRANDTVVRSSLVWLPSDDLEVIAKLEISEFEDQGAPNRLDDAGEYLPIYQAAQSDFSTGGYDRFTQPETSKTRSKLASVTANWDLDDYTLTSVSGWSEYTYRTDQDVDFGPLEVLNQTQVQDYEQFSQEFRITSPEGETLEYIAGVFYQRTWLDNQAQVNRNYDPVLDPADVAQVGITTGAAYIFSQCGAPPSPLTPAYNACRIANSAAANQAGQDAVDAFTAPYATLTDFSQNSESWAIFGQVTWNIDEDWSLTAGFRYTEEHKTAQRTLVYNEFQSDDALGTSSANANNIIAFSNLLGVEAHEIKDKYEPESLSPSLHLQYQWDDNTMIYASISQGYKSGGFNAVGTSDTSFDFEDEEVIGYELGAKSSLLGGQATVSAAAFYNLYDNLQVSAFEVGSFEITNAAQAVTQGIEFNGSWNITPDLKLSGAATWLEAYYREFENASCTLDQINALPQGSNCTQDLSGEDLAYAPEWNISLGLDHRYRLNEDMELLSYLGAVYIDDMYLTQDQDDFTKEEAHILVNARLGLAAVSGGWEVSLLGKNITDEEMRGFADDVPGTSGGQIAYVLPPRSVAIQFKLFY